MGINVLDSSGKLRDMGEVIEEVGGKWSSYSKEQQVAIAGIMGGQRQVNQITALFDNWDEYTESIETMADAEGTLQKQQDIYMESAEGQLQKLRTEWEGVLDSLLSSDDIIKVAKSIQPIFESLEKVIDAFGGGIGILTKFSPLLLSLISPKISEGIAKIGMSFENTKINAEIAKSEVEDFQNQLNQKVGEGAELSGYTKQIQDLINKYGELSKTMSTEQKNQFKESLASLIEKEGPKATKQLEEYQNKLKEIKSLEVGKDNKILENVIDTRDEKAIENYQEKIENLQKTLSQPINKNNFEQIKKQIQDTLGDSNIAKELIENLELGVKEVNFSGMAEKIEEVFQNIDVVDIQEKANEIFGEGTEGAENFANGIGRIRDLEQQILVSEERIAENQIQQAAAEAELNKIKEKKAQFTKQIQQEEEEIAKQTSNQQELLEQYNVDNIEALKEELRIKQESGEIDTDLMMTINQYEVYQEKIDGAAQSVDNLKKQIEEQNKKQKENQQAYVEAQHMEQVRIDLIREHRKEIKQIQNDLKNGALTEEEANQLIAESTKKVSDEMENLKDKLGETATAMQEVRQQGAETSAGARSLFQSFEEIEKINFAQHFMDIGQAAISLGSAFESLVKLADIWDDEDLTQGEKVIQTFTILGTVIPIVISSVSSGIAAFKALASAETASAIASAIKTVAMGSEAVAAKLAGKAVEELTLAEFAATVGAGALATAILPIIAIVAALGVAIFAIVKIIQKWREEHKTSTENLKEANENLKEATDKYNEMKSAVADYKDAKKGLDELEKGTVEYAEAVTDLNSKVLELIEKYPELKKFMTVGKDGVLTISDEGLEELQKKQKEELDVANRNAIAEGVYTDQDRKNLYNKYEMNAVDPLLTQPDLWRVDDDLLTELKATKAAYEAELEAMHKSDVNLMTSYAKTFDQLADYESNEVSAVIEKLYYQYNGDIEKIKAAIADTNGMINSLNANKKVTNYIQERKGVNVDIFDVLNGDYSSVSGKDLTGLKNLTGDAAAIDVLAQNIYGEVTEETRQKIIESLQDAANEITEEITELPSPLRAWVVADNVDLDIAEKFVEVGQSLAYNTTRGMTEGLTKLKGELENQLEGEGFEAFTTLLSSFDWYQNDAWNVFLKTLEEMGIEIENMPDGIRNWADAMSLLGQSVDTSTVKIDNLITAAGEISKLKYGSELSAKNFEELTTLFPEISKYFDEIGDKYRFVATDIDTVNKEINKSFKESLQNLKDYQNALQNSGINDINLEGTEEHISNVKKFFGDNAEDRTETKKDGTTIIKSEWKDFTNDAKKQIEDIKELGEDVLNNLQGFSVEAVTELEKAMNEGTMTDEQWQQYFDLIKQIKQAKTDASNTELISEEEDKIIAAEINSLEELERLQTEIGYSDEAIARNRTKIRQRELQELGITEEAYKNYLKAIGENISKINNTEIMIKFKIDLNGKKAAEDIGKIFDGITEKTNEAEKAVAQSNLQNILRNQLGIDLGFFNNEENFDLFGKMIAGDEESEKELKDRLQRMQKVLIDAAAHADEKRAEELKAEAEQYGEMIDYINDYTDDFKKAAKERIDAIKQESIELQKSQAEFARSQTQRSINKVEDKMAHATGDDWVKLYNKREQLRKQEIADAKQIMKLDEDLLNSEKKRFNETEKNVQVSADQISHFIDEGLTLDKIIERTHAQGEDISLVSSLVKSIITANQTRIQQEQEIADLEEEQVGILASIYEVREGTINTARDNKKANLDNQFSEIDNQISVASGSELVTLLEKRRNLEKEYINLMQEEKQQADDFVKAKKEELAIIGDKIYYDDQGFAIAIDESNITEEELSKIKEYNEAKNEQLGLERDIANYYEKQYLYIDKQANEKRAIMVKERQLAILQKQAANLSGDTLLKNLKEQRKLEGEITEQKRQQYKVLKDTLKENSQSLEDELERIGINIKVDYFKDGSIANLEEILNAVNGTEFASNIENMANAVNDAADEVSDFGDSLVDAAIALGSTFGMDYDVDIKDKILEREDKKDQRILEHSDPSSPEAAAATARIRNRKQEKIDNKRERVENQILKEGINEKDKTTRYTSDINEAASGLGDMLNGKITDYLDSETGLYRVGDLQKIYNAKIGTMSEQQLEEYKLTDEYKAWQMLLESLEKNNSALIELGDRQDEYTEALSEMDPSFWDKNADAINDSSRAIKKYEQEIDKLQKERQYATPEEQIEIDKQISEKRIKIKKEEEKKIESLNAQTTAAIGSAVSYAAGLKDKDGNDIFKAGMITPETFFGKDGKLLSDEEIHTALNWGALDDETRTFFDNMISKARESQEASEELQNALLKFHLPYDEYAKTAAQANVLNQEQEKLNREIEDSSMKLEELQKEESHLYGNDLIANLETQVDAYKDILRLKKEEVALANEEVTLAEREKADANEKKTKYQNSLKAAFSNAKLDLSDFNFEDYLLADGTLDREAISKYFGDIVDIESIPELVQAMDNYDKGVQDVADADKKLEESKQRVTKATNDETDAQRDLADAEREVIETKLKLAEEVITRQTTKMYELNKAAREVSDGLEKVSRYSSGSSGSGLVDLLKDELKLRKENLEILKEQKKEADSQLQSFVDLYNTTLKEDYGIDFEFEVDENGIANITEFYKMLEGLPKDLRDQIERLYPGWISQMESAAQASQGLTDSIRDEKNAIEDAAKAMKQADLEGKEKEIQRETTAFHALTEQLRQVEEAIEKVQRAQDGLSGQKLINKIQEEIALQEQKKAVLEQQLVQIEKQIQALASLYAAYMSTMYGAGISFQIDQSGVANLDSLYGTINGLNKTVRGQALQDLEKFISTLNGLAGTASSTKGSITSMTNAIEDLRKKQKEAEEEDKFRIKDELWYNEEQALKAIARELKNIQKEQSHLTGQALIDNLEKQQRILERQANIQQRKLKIMQSQVKAAQALLAIQGVTFDSTGLISNYASIFAKGNDKLNGYLQTYQQLYDSTLDLQVEIRDSYDQIDDIRDAKMAERFRTREELWFDEEQALKRIEKALVKVQKEQNSLTGNALIKNLEAQQKILEKQAEAQQRKVLLMKTELATMQALLIGYGVLFDEQGQIANYTGIYSKGDTRVNSYMDSYQQLYEQIEELEDGVQETFDQKTDLEIEKMAERLRMFNEKIDIELDFEKGRREWEKFKKELLNTWYNLSELNDSILEKAKQNLRDITALFEKDVPLLTDHVNQIMDEILLMQSGEKSDLYGSDQKQALEDLKNYKGQLEDTLQSIEDSILSLEEAYLNQVNKIKGQFDEVLGNYELIENIIKHDMNIIKILKGSGAYDKLDTYYDKSIDNYKAQLGFLKDQVDYWKNLMDKETVGTKRWQTFQKNWTDALSKMNSAVDNALNAVVDKYSAKFDEIFGNLERNSGAKNFNEKWDMQKTKESLFNDELTNLKDFAVAGEQLKSLLATEEDAAAAEKLEEEYNKIINHFQEIRNSRQGNTKLTKKETELMKEELEKAQKIVEQEKLKAELKEKEEATAQKTQMRLRRDSSGDYRYEFVANEEEEEERQKEIKDLTAQIADLEVEILEKQDEIRLGWEDAAEEAMEFFISTQEDVISKIKQLQDELNNGFITQEEFDQKADFYKKYLNDIAIITKQVGTTALNELSTSTDEEVNRLEDAVENSLLKISTEYFPKAAEEVSPTFDMLKEFFSTTVSHIQEAYSSAINELIQVSQEFKDALYEIGEAAGVTFDDIISGIDPAILAVQDLTGENEILLEGYKEELNAIDDLIEELERLKEAYQDVLDAALEAVDAALELKEVEGDLPDYSNNININVGGHNVSVVGGETDITDNPNSTTDIGNYNKTDINTNSDKDYSNADKIDVLRAAALLRLTEGFNLTGKDWQEEYLSGGSLADLADLVGHFSSRSEVTGANATDPDKALEEYIEIAKKILEENKQNYGWELAEMTKYSFENLTRWVQDAMHNMTKKVSEAYHAQSNLDRETWFDTGGYTGAWGSSGKLAVLHEKELVLNKVDTENLLKTIEIVRSQDLNNNLVANILNTIPMLTEQTLAPYSQFLMSTKGILEEIGAMTNTITNQNNATNTTTNHINANFPNVSSSSEIEKALKNLSNATSQRLGLNKR